MPSVQIHPKERERIDSCSERFRPLAWQLYREINDMCATENCSPLVVYGFRSASEQLAIWSHGRELIGPGLDIMHASSWRLTADPSDKILTRAFPGQSAHNTGDAVDIALVEGIGATRHWIMDPGVPRCRITATPRDGDLPPFLDTLECDAEDIIEAGERMARLLWAHGLNPAAYEISASPIGDRWHRIVGSAAKRLGLKWGGEFSFFDGAHVQHPEWTIKDRRV